MRCLAQARACEVIEVTSHDEPVARLVGVPQRAPAGIGQMIVSGVAAWSGRKLELAPPVRLSHGGLAVSRVVIEDRG